MGAPVHLESRELLGAQVDGEVEAAAQWGLQARSTTSTTSTTSTMSTTSTRSRLDHQSGSRVKSSPSSKSSTSPGHPPVWAHMELTKLCVNSRELLGDQVEGEVQSVVQVLLASCFLLLASRFLLLASSVVPRQVTVKSMGDLTYIPSLTNDMRDESRSSHWSAGREACSLAGRPFPARLPPRERVED